MTKLSAGFYFANLGADALRCAIAAESGDSKEYATSLERAWRSLRMLEDCAEAYEEGLLLMRGLEYARREGNLAAFRDHLDQTIAPFAARLGFA